MAGGGVLGTASPLPVVVNVKSVNVKRVFTRMVAKSEVAESPVAKAKSAESPVAKAKKPWW